MMESLSRMPELPRPESAAHPAVTVAEALAPRVRPDLGLGYQGAAVRPGEWNRLEES